MWSLYFDFFIPLSFLPAGLYPGNWNKRSHLNRPYCSHMNKFVHCPALGYTSCSLSAWFSHAASISWVLCWVLETGLWGRHSRYSQEFLVREPGISRSLQGRVKDAGQGVCTPRGTALGCINNAVLVSLRRPTDTSNGESSTSEVGVWSGAT